MSAPPAGAACPQLRPARTLLRRLSLTAAAASDATGGAVAARLRRSIDARKPDVVALLAAVLREGGRDDDGTLRPHVLRDALAAAAGPGPHADGGQLEELLAICVEAVVVPPCVGLALRPAVGGTVHVRVCASTLRCERVSVAAYLEMKEALAGARPSATDAVIGPLEVDFGPFARGAPFLTRPQSIGSGALFLNRHLASRLATSGHDPLFGYLASLTVEGTDVMLNRRAASAAALAPALARALGWLTTLPGDTEWGCVADRLAEMGFEPGWGADVDAVRATMDLLADVLEAADPDRLAEFIARVPAVTRVALVSPHGFFAQAGVLGKPDTGGQVVYILDQARALEAEMKSRLAAAGLPHVAPRIVILTRLIPDAEGTTCDTRIEKVAGCDHATILRVPFRDARGRVVRPWVSRFCVWPYLERFAVDGGGELVAEMGGAPQMIVGNYSDGNLVASLLATHFDAAHLQIAHALEMSKYADYATLWASPRYAGQHPAVQMVADVLTMARADCIITSTYQEIAGKSAGVTAGSVEAPGQYELYESFTLPGVVRVTHGVNVFDPRFNIVSPGADASVYFAYDEADRRVTAAQAGLEEMVWGGEQAPLARGTIKRDGKPLLFAMGRNDSVKNMVGLAQWFADSPRLQAAASLLIVSGSVVVDDAPDADGAACARALHALFDAGGLPEGGARWVRAQANPVRNGELYRMVADTRGAFVMPSLYEAFGLVTVEAMTSGLPTFVSFNGGGAEIVKDGLNGFHIDPFHGAAAADKMADFFEAAKADGGASWDAVSTAARARVADRYTWPIYARRLLSLAKISGFYRSIMGEEARPRRAYQAALFHLLLRPLMAGVPAVGGEGEGGGKGEDGAEKRAGGEKVDGVVCEACGRG